VSEKLLVGGHEVIGVDNLNDYYDPMLKQTRLDLLKKHSQFRFYKADISNQAEVRNIFNRHPSISVIIHLAAQAGVRYSLVNPMAYIESNIRGMVVMLEAARTHGRIKHFVYASSSSVYGLNKKLPYAVTDVADSPVSLYAATKKSCELIAHSYSHLFRIPTTGLRLFTVYGPWGRPDMSPFLFLRAIERGEAIRIFNWGNMSRDFTFIDDIVDGVIAACDAVPDHDPVPFAVFNLGNSQSIPLMKFVSTIEVALGTRAKYEFMEMQPGDVKDTYADIQAAQARFGFSPKVSIEKGVIRFVEWYKMFYGKSV